MATANPYDPLAAFKGEPEQLLQQGTPQQGGIVATAMQSPTTMATTAAPAPAPAPATTQTAPATGIVAQQLAAPTPWTVTNDQTVEGRINNIIKAGSPLMEQAKTRSMEAMNARGLSNSSMAITAGESALYDAALPIAQADAATAAKAAGYNVDQGNQFAVRNAEFENQFRLADKQAQGERDLALINRETQVQLSQLDAQQKATAAQIQNQHQKVLETNTQANEAFRVALSAINNIQLNNQMDSGAKTQAVASIWRDLQTQLKVLGSVSGLNLTSQLNFANYPGFDANGNYVGFPGGVPGSAPAPVPAPWPGGIIGGIGIGGIGDGGDGGP